MSLELHRGQMMDFKCSAAWLPAGQIFRDAAEADRDKAQMQGLAGLLAAIGDGAGAMSSIRASNAEVSVKAVEFRMGSNLFRGLLDDCPFVSTDDVAVVSQWHPDQGFHEVKAIARPSDRLIALWPSCSRGRKAYFRRAGKRWLVVSLLIAMGAGYVLWPDALSDIGGLTKPLLITLGGSALYAFIEHRIYVENYRPLVHLTERILSMLGVPNAQSVDLIKLSIATRTDAEPMGYRWSFFRY